MARLRILPLPGDGDPFAIVIDRADQDEIAAMGLGFNHVVPDYNPYADLVNRLGARTIILSEREIELPGDCAALLRQRADELDRLQRDIGYPMRQHNEPVTLTAEQYRAAAAVLDEAS